MLAVLGLLLWAVGWIAATLAHPLLAGGSVPWSAVALNALAGMTAGATFSQFYAWFTTGQADALMAARGGAAGLVATTAAAPFMPLWSALLVGAVTGLMVPLLVFLVEEILRFRDPSGALPVSFCGGLIGLLAVGLFASGRFGAGPSQLGAQLLGIGVILALGLMGGGLLLHFSRYLSSSHTPRQRPAVRDEEE
jgi:Amt family ammonium transporter